MTVISLSIAKQLINRIENANLPSSTQFGQAYQVGLNNLGPSNPTPPKKYAVIMSGTSSYTFDIIDEKSDVSDAGHIVWTEVPRAGQLSWLVPSTRRLYKKHYTGTIWKNGQTIDDDINNLMHISAVGDVVTFIYGQFESGQYRLTDLSLSVTKRQNGTHNAISATYDLTLTQASDPPTPKPVSTAPAPATPTPVNAPAAGPKDTYTIKSGDSLWNIAVKYYNNGSMWTKIADANGIKDPRRIQPGQKLTIP